MLTLAVRVRGFGGAVINMYDAPLVRVLRLLALLKLGVDDWYVNNGLATSSVGAWTRLVRADDSIQLHFLLLKHLGRHLGRCLLMVDVEVIEFKLEHRVRREARGQRLLRQ